MKLSFIHRKSSHHFPSAGRQSPRSIHGERAEGDTAVKRVVYLLDIFPTVSETFILNEILTVTDRNIDVTIFARHFPREEALHRDAGPLKNKTKYLVKPREISLGKILKAHLYLLCVRPVPYLKTLWFAYGKKKQGLLWYFKIAGYYAPLIARERPDHIHSHFASLAGEYAMLVSMILRIPYTFTAHGWHDIYAYPPADFYDRAMQAHKVVTVSYYNARYISEKFSIPPEKIAVVHCGVQWEIYTPKVFFPGEKPLKILSVARLHPIKGVEYLIKACKILKDKSVDFVCSIVGDGEDRLAMTQLIRELDLSAHVRLDGALPMEEVRRRYSQSDIYVQSSLCEGLPVAVMEAMASRLAIVASNVTGMPELIENDTNGYLVEAKDAAGLAEAMERLASNPQARATIGERNAQKIKNNFSIEEEVQKLIHVWFPDMPVAELN